MTPSMKSPVPAVLLLRLSLAFVWIYTGIICLAFVPTERSLDLLSAVGMHGDFARWTVCVTSGFEVLLGIAVGGGLWPRVLAAVQIVLIIGFTTIISVFLPEFWLDPFGPVSKNVVLIAAAYVVGREGTASRNG